MFTLAPSLRLATLDSGARSVTPSSRQFSPRTTLGGKDRARTAIGSQKPCYPRKTPSAVYEVIVDLTECCVLIVANRSMGILATVLPVVSSIINLLYQQLSEPVPEIASDTTMASTPVLFDYGKAVYPSLITLLTPPQEPPPTAVKSTTSAPPPTSKSSPVHNPPSYPAPPSKTSA